ncbi:maleylpyruvate isomerase family mycothiol-dependent enzyme [Actinoplanes sp. KI2]|uniref:maleylpyruvate isomerase family mycothiol-dependent enzyme n=1 Tax=Actinoplanes sp. KI2 TaxID=2983315 RepID=UPI0021D61489|nr:maleylpyruvate isomerase family mycothiol-dependent enzyme [Actinoplanes sp. KI2]MCU7726366.1 maleylpyruvate isomerase family mycothiol-dependent enzyme [Actinoplanes sp. KI2]
MTPPDVIEDLAAEQDQIEALLTKLSPADWLTPSAAAGWTIADVVLHLAQTEEAVCAALGTGRPPVRWGDYGSTVDDAMDAMVRSQRAEPAEVFERWRTAHRESIAALRAADPQRPVQWVAAPLKPPALATTRLAEHWAHAALDIAPPLGLDYPDTARLRHIAWLGHRTLPYAFRVAGLPVVEVFCDLTAPDGSAWRFGDPAAESAITGSAGAFCRVGAQRLAPSASGLQTKGAYGEVALRLLRNYAAS